MLPVDPRLTLSADTVIFTTWAVAFLILKVYTPEPVSVNPLIVASPCPLNPKSPDSNPGTAVLLASLTVTVRTEVETPSAATLSGVALTMDVPAFGGPA